VFAERVKKSRSRRASRSINLVGNLVTHHNEYFRELVFLARVLGGAATPFARISVAKT
jgi:hypothetical protein